MNEELGFTESLQNNESERVDQIEKGVCFTRKGGNDVKENKKRLLLWWYKFTGQLGKWSSLYLYDDNLMEKPLQKKDEMMEVSQN